MSAKIFENTCVPSASEGGHQGARDPTRSWSLTPGIQAVSSLLEAEPARVSKLFFITGHSNPRLASLLEVAKRAGIEIRQLPRREFEARVRTSAHQGVAAECRHENVGGEAEWRKALAAAKPLDLALALDGVQDPRNLGACLRVAAAAGAVAAVAPKSRGAPLSPVARKAAAGGSTVLPLYRAANFARCLAAAQELNVLVVGLAEDGEENLYDLNLTGPIVLVVGSEDRGLRPLTRRHCDLLARIPMTRPGLNLNVSAAAAVALFEMRRQLESEASSPTARDRTSPP